jgi:hypothetical protein
MGLGKSVSEGRRGRGGRYQKIVKGKYISINNKRSEQQIK